MTPVATQREVDLTVQAVWQDPLRLALRASDTTSLAPLDNLVGGPEIIPRFEQHDAIKNGVVGAGIIAAADLQNRIPEQLTGNL